MLLPHAGTAYRTEVWPPVGLVPTLQIRGHIVGVQNLANFAGNGTVHEYILLVDICERIMP